MHFFENFRIALRALAANKLRSALTMLGIIIGARVGAGATASITSHVQGIGSNVVVIFPGGSKGNQSTTPAFLYDSAYEALAKNLHSISAIAPSYAAGGRNITDGKKTTSAPVTASTPGFAEIGIHPAFRAARLRPIDALRYE